LKIFSVGFDKYWMEGQNQFDFVVTWVIGTEIDIFWIVENYIFFLSANG